MKDGAHKNGNILFSVKVGYTCEVWRHLTYIVGNFRLIFHSCAEVVRGLSELNLRIKFIFFDEQVGQILSLLNPGDLMFREPSHANSVLGQVTNQVKFSQPSQVRGID